MTFDYENKCLLRFRLKGETHVSIYQEMKIVFIDNLPKDSARKAFFCDFNGNILCPVQMSNLLKKNKHFEPVSNFFLDDIALIFFTCDAMKLDNIEQGTYFNLSDTCTSCYLKIIFSNGNFCLGIIRNSPDQELSECLDLLPSDMSNWNWMVLKDDSISVVTE